MYSVIWVYLIMLRRLIVKKIYDIILLAALFSSSLFSNNLSEISTFSTGAYPRGIAAADVNGDGVKEIVVANFGAGTLIGQDSAVASTSSISVFTKDGTSFKSSVMASGMSPRGVAAGNLSNNKHDDIVVSNYDDGTISIYSGTGSMNLDAGRHPVGVAIGDVNNDGFNDIAVAVYSENKVVVFIATGKGNYKKYSVDVAGSPTDVTIGEINGSKVIVSANYTSASVSIIKFDGTSLVKTSDVAVGSGPCKVRIADVTGDKINDIITSNFYDNTVSVIPSGSGAVVSYKLGGIRPNGMAVADINGDGFNDVITANRDDDTIDILLQKDGKLVLSKTIKVSDDKDKSMGPVEVATGDFNSDGLTDIAFTHMRTNTLKVIYQQLPASPVITSSTHPDQASWFTGSTAAFSLAAQDFTGIDLFLYSISKEQNAFDRGTAKSSISPEISITGLESGTYYFSAAVKDKAGNISALPAVYKINITEELSEKNTYNYPNPCSGPTTIRFALAAPEDVKLVIFDANGHLVWHKELSAASVIGGVNHITWELLNDNGMQVANGVYGLKVITGSKVINKKIAVVK
jgi:hypothetical protein